MSKFARDAARKMFECGMIWEVQQPDVAKIIDEQYAPLIAAAREVRMVRNSLASRNQLNRAIGRLCQQLALHDQETP